MALQRPFGAGSAFISVPGTREAVADRAMEVVKQLVSSKMLAIEADLPRYVDQRMRDGSKGITNGVAGLIDALNRGLINPDARQGVHIRAAERATAAVVEDYLASVKQWHNVQRTNNRFSGGKLGDLLATPGIVAEPTADGVVFLAGIGELDDQARQWRRLQYGAGARGGAIKGPGRNAAAEVPMTFDGIVVKTFSLRSAPRPAFDVPPGFWKTEGGQAVRWSNERRGQDEFFPRANFATKYGIPTRAGSFHGATQYPTRGIESRRYLDRGLFEMAATLSEGYTVLLANARAEGERAFNSAVQAASAGVVGFKPTRPRLQSL